MKLSEELRSKQSRDNRALLDRAADRIDELEAGYRKQSEVAEEIFEELEAILNSDGFHYFFRTFKYDELKKKYTEGET